MKTSLERKNEIDKIQMYLLIKGINLSNLDLEPLINCMDEFIKNGNDNSIEILPFGYRDKIKLILKARKGVSCQVIFINPEK